VVCASHRRLRDNDDDARPQFFTKAGDPRRLRSPKGNPHMTTPAPQPAAAQPLSEAEDKQWASFAHFGNILSFIAPLVIWLIFKDRGTKTNVEGKEALNWGITITIVFVVLQVLNAILAFVFFPLSFLTGLLIFAAIVVNIILAIMGGVKVNGGGSYRYPFAIRLVK
jgi:uncharacterized Tic20 family protein